VSVPYKVARFATGWLRREVGTRHLWQDHDNGDLSAGHVEREDRLTCDSSQERGKNG
jgi:hypothetical protein